MVKQRRPAPKPASTRKKAPASKKPVAKGRKATPAMSLVEEKRSSYVEAVGFYERGIQAMQRRDFKSAAVALRTVLSGYPEERELHERARLYLRVCEREIEPRTSDPKTVDDLVYAGTLAVNAGDLDRAIGHLEAALRQDPEDDRAHYVLAVARSQRGEVELALEHLRRAIELEPENRSLARQEADLDVLRGQDGFRQILEAPGSHGARRRPRRTSV